MLAFLFVSAHALQLDVPPTELCARAPVVGIVEVTSQEVRWSEGPRAGLETHTWLHVHRLLKGSVAGETVEAVQRGGVLPSGLKQSVEDEARWTEDHRYLVFLAPRGDTWRVVGGELGQFHLGPSSDLDAAIRGLGGCLD